MLAMKQDHITESFKISDEYMFHMVFSFPEHNAN